MGKGWSEGYSGQSLFPPLGQIIDVGWEVGGQSPQDGITESY